MQKFGGILEFMKGFLNKLSSWLFAVAAIVIVPMLPLLVELAKFGSVKDESLYMTAAVLAVGFGFTSEGNFFRTAYILLFLLSIAADYRPEQPSHATVALSDAQTASMSVWIFGHAALMALCLTALAQAVERFNWHVVLDRRFPDWLEKS